MSDVLELRFAARAAELKKMRSAVREYLHAQGCGEECANDVVLAVDEACQNVIRHAYCDGEPGPIELRVERADGALVISIRDEAPTVDPDCLERSRRLEDVRPGGLGTHFMKSVMDEVGFVDLPEGEGNLLRMVKNLVPR